MKQLNYVLITPVRNEEATIEITIQSVLSQTVLPREWVIVSDESSDSTDDIVRRYVNMNSFIRLVRIEDRPQRSFDSVVFATETGIKSLKDTGYDYICLLDADVRFRPEYFETLIKRFDECPDLGLAGGLVLDVVDGKMRRSRQYLGEVAGATQFFRRDCFEAIVPLIPVPEGGWDTITCVQARTKGYKTLTFPDLIVEHLKPRNIAEGNIIRRQWQLGQRDYALGYHPVFEVLKCISKFLEPLIILGTAARLAGYTWCCIIGRKRVISTQMIKMIRREQINRLIPNFLSSSQRK